MKLNPELTGVVEAVVAVDTAEAVEAAVAVVVTAADAIVTTIVSNANLVGRKQ
jgi:hypothetical protein